MFAWLIAQIKYARSLRAELRDARWRRQYPHLYTASFFARRDAWMSDPRTFDPRGRFARLFRLPIVREVTVIGNRSGSMCTPNHERSREE